MENLRAALQALDGKTMPQALSAHKIGYDSLDYLTAQFAEMPKIYGLNTLPGHKVGEQVEEAEFVRFQFDLIANHRLGSAPYLDAKTARAVTIAKLFATASGQTLVSRSLYETILKAAADETFAPQIPQHASYSAGDVIPAAHWAQALLDWQKNPRLLPGEGMALINGAFVHVGVTLSLAHDLQSFWPFYIDTATQSFRTLRADARVLSDPAVPHAGWFGETMAHVKKSLENVRRSSAVQDAVSLRSFPQTTQAAVSAIERLMAELDSALGLPSGNPLLVKRKDGKLDFSPSGSFGQPALALAASSVIETLLMLGWNISQRITHMLDGTMAGLPKDGMTDNDPLGMIQWPKLAQAELERIRSTYGLRNFTSGSSTSGQVEDFWTNGTETSLKARQLVKDVERLLVIERRAAQRLGKIMAKDKTAAQIVVTGIDDAAIATAKAETKASAIPFPLKAA